MRKIIISEKKLLQIIKKIIREQESNNTSITQNNERSTIKPPMFIKSDSSSADTSKTTNTKTNFGYPTDSGSVALNDWKYATEVAQEIEQWWKSNEKDVFFKDFQEVIDDDDSGAANMYRVKLNDYRAKLKSKLSNGIYNTYYTNLDKWFNDIVDQIDDYFQNDCSLYLKSPDGKKQYVYIVDPEID